MKELRWGFVSASFSILVRNISKAGIAPARTGVASLEKIICTWCGYWNSSLLKRYYHWETLWIVVVCHTVRIWAMSIKTFHSSSCNWKCSMSWQCGLFRKLSIAWCNKIMRNYKLKITDTYQAHVNEIRQHIKSAVPSSAYVTQELFKGKNDGNPSRVLEPSVCVPY